MSCANYILVACMVISRANRTATHNYTAFKGHKVGRISGYISYTSHRKMSVCFVDCIFVLVWEFVCSYVSVCELMFTSRFLCLVVAAVSRHTYCSNWYANRSLTLIRDVFSSHWVHCNPFALSSVAQATCFLTEKQFRIQFVELH